MIRFSLISPMALLLMAGMAASAGAAEISGEARAIDARTLEVGGRTIQLFGIDAPDLGQTCTWAAKTIRCGEIAKTALMDLITGATVTCETSADGGRAETGAGQPVVAVCKADGFDIGANMVHTGWALADRAASHLYVATEDRARAARHGLWRGQFEMPSRWRQSRQ